MPAELGNGSWFGMAENGPLATTVEDAALVLSVLAGRPELATITRAGSVRIAVSTKPPFPGIPVDEHWAAAAAQETAVLLGGAGHSVRDADPSYGHLSGGSEAVRWFAGAELDARLLADRARMGARTMRHAAAGRLALRIGLPRPNGRKRWRGRAERFFAQHDVLVTPTLAQPPIAAKAWAQRGWLANLWSNARYAPFVGHWNLAGWPAMAVPAGLHPNGTPLSVQLVARPGREALLLSIAGQLEQLRPWPRTVPALDRH